jgi:hypothetical protein
LLGLAWLLSAWASLAPRSATYPVETLPVMLPREGCYGPEPLPGWSRSFCWTDGEASIHPPNPGGTFVLRLVLGGGPARTTPIQVQTGPLTTSFVVTPEPRTYALLGPPASSERLSLVLRSPTFREKGRALGVMVSTLRLSGGGSAPTHVVLALMAAAGGGFLLLRRARVPPLFAAGSIILLQASVLLWQVSGGWRYALAGPALWLVAGTSLGAVILGQVIQTIPASPLLLSSPPPHPRSDPRSRWFLLVLLLLALGLRLVWLAAPDPVGDLELSARRMGFLYRHGLAGAYLFDGDYLPLRLYLLSGLSRLVALFGGTFHEPLSAVTLTGIKLPGLLADLATIVIIYTWSRRWQPDRRAAAIAALYALAPPVWINVAWWGQVDALLMLPLVGMVLLLERATGRWSWLCWTVALLIKPQAIILAPLLFVSTLRLHGVREVAQGAALSAGLFAVACTPLVLSHQGPGLMQAYLGSVGRFPRLTIGAYNVWFLLTGGQSGDDSDLALGPLSYRVVGLLLVGGAALVVALVLLRRADHLTRLRGAAALSLSFFLLPTQIHERYLFLTLAFLGLCIASDPRMVGPYLVLLFTATLNILGTLSGFIPTLTPLITASPLPFLCAVVNIAVLVVVMGSLFFPPRSGSGSGRMPPNLV